MGVYDVELTRLDGEIKAYVKIQNDYTGAIIGQLRKIYLDGNEYYIRADGRRVNVSAQYERFKCLEKDFEEFLKSRVNERYGRDKW